MADFEKILDPEICKTSTLFIKHPMKKGACIQVCPSSTLPTWSATEKKISNIHSLMCFLEMKNLTKKRQNPKRGTKMQNMA